MPDQETQPLKTHRVDTRLSKKTIRTKHDITETENNLNSLKTKMKTFHAVLEARSCINCTSEHYVKFNTVHMYISLKQLTTDLLSVGETIM